ncbi:hypothetical protein B0H10DRAFT_2342869 [Mycena sp. CBHHK59/15]|nr:hypothetical protein B0H10DRAFT_1967756 [Mycena sp. CBHHK59/15]KAJ6579323.1 hypothetical protein B0H10DRAFT_2342869 [Mycena sp. CBHHK59/15]
MADSVEGRNQTTRSKEDDSGRSIQLREAKPRTTVCDETKVGGGRHLEGYSPVMTMQCRRGRDTICRCRSAKTQVVLYRNGSLSAGTIISLVSEFYSLCLAWHEYSPLGQADERAIQDCEETGSYRSELFLRVLGGAHLRVYLKNEVSFGFPIGAALLVAAALERAFALCKDGSLSTEGIQHKGRKKANSFVPVPWAERAARYLPPIETLTPQKWHDIIALAAQFMNSKDSAPLFDDNSTDAESADASTLRRHLKGYLRRLRRGKKLADWTAKKFIDGSAEAERDKELTALRTDWPRLIPSSRKHMLVEAFNMAISKDALATFVCASCSGKYLVNNKRTLGLDDFDINLLRRPDYVDPQSRPYISACSILQRVNQLSIF